nr:hypothetical protein [Olsenella urininfantis]
MAFPDSAKSPQSSSERTLRALTRWHLSNVSRPTIDGMPPSILTSSHTYVPTYFSFLSICWTIEGPHGLPV